MILCGIGVTMLTRRAVASNDRAMIGAARRMLVYRGLFLLLLGVINLYFWPGDILRVYGVSMVVAALLITASGRVLWLASLGFMAGFMALFAWIDYGAHWDWDSMLYDDHWSTGGFVRFLFYDGYRSVFPWAGMLCFGMWLGRLKLRDVRVNTMLWVISLAIACGISSISSVLADVFSRIPAGMDAETIVALFGSESMPPLPLFLLSSMAQAVFVIAVCVRLVGERAIAPVQALASTGQMALTWYVIHIAVVIGIASVPALFSTQTSIVATACGMSFFAITVVLSWLWKKSFRHGPLEWVMRKLTG
jgi:uncharacterized membrane protein YeiB